MWRHSAAVHFSSPRTELHTASLQCSTYVICTLCFSTSFKCAHVRTSRHCVCVCRGGESCVSLALFAAFLSPRINVTGCVWVRHIALPFALRCPSTVAAGGTETSQMPLYENALLFFIRLLTLSYRRRPLVCEHNLPCLFFIPLSPPQPPDPRKARAGELFLSGGVEGAQGSGGGCLVLCVSWPPRPLSPPLTDGKHGCSSSQRGSQARGENAAASSVSRADAHTRTG